VTDMSPWGNPQADGISVACKDSIVEKNVSLNGFARAELAGEPPLTFAQIVTDTTDGGIVLFGSSGTEVRDNDVYARTRVILGGELISSHNIRHVDRIDAHTGINMVDYDPWDGDYKDTKVHHNRLHALGRYFKTGIVIGPASWSDETETIVKSGVVTDNIFDGAHFGYGIVISSADDFTVLRNTLGEGARFAGVPGIRCPRAPGNGKPTAFLINRGSAKGTFQTDFVNGEVQHSAWLHSLSRIECRGGGLNTSQSFVSRHQTRTDDPTRHGDYVTHQRTSLPRLPTLPVSQKALCVCVAPAPHCCYADNALRTPDSQRRSSRTRPLCSRRWIRSLR
jgi:hypothetical protein